MQEKLHTFMQDLDYVKVCAWAACAMHPVSLRAAQVAELFSAARTAVDDGHLKDVTLFLVKGSHIGYGTSPPSMPLAGGSVPVDLHQSATLAHALSEAAVRVMQRTRFHWK